MTDDTLGWVFGIGVAQGVFLMFALASLNVRNSTARWLFAAFIFVFTILLLEELLEVLNIPFLPGFGLAAEFAVSPLLYLFIASLAEDDPTPIRRQWLHFVPLSLATLWLSYLYLGPSGGWVSLSNPAIRHLVAATVFVKIAYFIFYAVMILRRPLMLAAKPLDTQRALRWVRTGIWFVCGIYFISAASFIAFYFKAEWAIDSDIVSALLLVFSIYALGYFTIANRNVFDAKGRDTKARSADAETERLAQQVFTYLDSSNAHLDSNLSLRAIADHLKVSDAVLSQALNSSAEGGFYAIVNGRRLAAFHILLKDPDNRGRTILELAFDAGFNSKATFYRFFRARHGVTPSAYRAQLLAQGPNEPDETKKLAAQQST